MVAPSPSSDEILSAGEVDGALDDIALIGRLEAMFKGQLDAAGGDRRALPDGMLLLMPA